MNNNSIQIQKILSALSKQKLIYRTDLNTMTVQRKRLLPLSPFSRDQIMKYINQGNVGVVTVYSAIKPTLEAYFKNPKRVRNSMLYCEKNDTLFPLNEKRKDLKKIGKISKDKREDYIIDLFFRKIRSKRIGDKCRAKISYNFDAWVAEYNNLLSFWNMKSLNMLMNIWAKIKERALMTPGYDTKKGSLFFSKATELTPSFVKTTKEEIISDYDMDKPEIKEEHKIDIEDKDGNDISLLSLAQEVIDTEKELTYYVSYYSCETGALVKTQERILTFIQAAFILKNMLNL